MLELTGDDCAVGTTEPDADEAGVDGRLVLREIADPRRGGEFGLKVSARLKYALGGAAKRRDTVSSRRKLKRSMG